MRKNVKINIKKLCDDAVLPTYATSGSVGADLSCVENFVLHPGARLLVGCGFSMELPDAYEAQIRPRSGLASKHGITVANAPGTIDSDYRGEVKVLLVNTSNLTYRGTKGDRIAQMVINPVTIGKFINSDELLETERGEKGFGSTGT